MVSLFNIYLIMLLNDKSLIDLVNNPDLQIKVKRKADLFNIK